MSVRIKRGRGDRIVNAIKMALRTYAAEHPGAEAEVYRYNSACVRIRVVDTRFAGRSFDKRHDGLWEYLKARLPDGVMGEVSLLVPVTPAEKARDGASVEFDHPSPAYT